MFGMGSGLWSTQQLADPIFALDPLAWYDPSDRGTLFQDAAGLVPVVAAGDPVRLMQDKSGNGYHLVANSDAARPTYETDGRRHWLSATDDQPMSSSSPLPFSENAFNCTAFRLTTFAGSAPQPFRNRGNTNAPDTRHPMVSLSQSEPNRIGMIFGSHASQDLNYSVLDADMVVSGFADGGARSQNANGWEMQEVGQGLLTDGNTQPVAIMQGGFRGRFYGAVQVNRVPSPNEILAVRAHYAEKSGGIGSLTAPERITPVALYDPSDTSTLFQDLAGTIPATGLGDPVRLMLDKSGNGHHVMAPSDAARPTLRAGAGRTWLKFIDGQSLVGASALPFSENVFNCTAFRLAEFGASPPHPFRNRGNTSGADTRHPLISMSEDEPNRVSMIFGANPGQDLGFSVVGEDIVISGYASADVRNQNANGVSLDETGHATLTDGNTLPVSIGANGFLGRFYGAVQANAIPTPDEIAAIRNFYSVKSGGTA